MALELVALQYMKDEAAKEAKKKWSVMHDLIFSENGGLVPSAVAEQINDGPPKIFYIETLYDYPNPPITRKYEVTKISAHGTHDLNDVGKHQAGIEIQPTDEVIPGTWWYRLSIKLANDIQIFLQENRAAMTASDYCRLTGGLDVGQEREVIIYPGWREREIYDSLEWPESFGEAIEKIEAGEIKANKSTVKKLHTLRECELAEYEKLTVEDDLLRDAWANSKWAKTWSEVKEDERCKLIYKHECGGKIEIEGKIEKIVANDSEENWTSSYPEKNCIEVAPDSKIPIGTQWYSIEVVNEYGRHSYRTISSGMPSRFYTWPKKFGKAKSWKKNAAEVAATKDSKTEHSKTVLWKMYRSVLEVFGH